MHAPSIHVNGTDGNQLADEWGRIALQASFLREMLEKSPLNARDYYPQGTNAYDEANKDLMRLVFEAKQIERELNQLVSNITSDMDAHVGRLGISRVREVGPKPLGFWMDDKGNVR